MSKPLLQVIRHRITLHVWIIYFSHRAEEYRYFKVDKRVIFSLFLVSRTFFDREAN